MDVGKLGTKILETPDSRRLLGFLGGGFLVPIPRRRETLWALDLLSTLACIRPHQYRRRSTTSRNQYSLLHHLAAPFRRSKGGHFLPTDSQWTLIAVRLVPDTPVGVTIILIPDAVFVLATLVYLSNGISRNLK
jgi:hypothetical protein